jgi:hypothetical protein
MKCRYCNIALAPLRTLTDGEFCSDEHRMAYSEEGGEETLSPPRESGLVPLGASFDPAKFESAAGEIPAGPINPSVPLEFRPKTMAAPAFSAPAEPRDIKKWFGLQERLLSLKFGAQLFNTPSRRVTPSAAEPKFPTAPVLPGAFIEEPRAAAQAGWQADEDGFAGEMDD